LKFIEILGEGDDCMSRDCQDFIMKLLVLDPKKRMKVDEIKAHPFFKGIFDNFGFI
jgi:serine/threonine protein kinase